VGYASPKCPVEAIIPGQRDPWLSKWLELNREYAGGLAEYYPKKPPPEDADEWREVEGKYEKFFSPTLAARRARSVADGLPALSRGHGLMCWLGRTYCDI